MEYKLYTTDQLRKKITNPQYGLLKDIRDKNGLWKDQIHRLQHWKGISFNATKALNDYFNGIFYNI